MVDKARKGEQPNSPMDKGKIGMGKGHVIISIKVVGKCWIKALTLEGETTVSVNQHKNPGRSTICQMHY